MPRRAPDGQGVTEHRITFGNYERSFVTEIKNDIEKGVKVATVSAIAIPLVVGASAVAGLGLLGYGIYRGLDSFGFGSVAPETLGCIVRKYARSIIPFGHIIFDDCDLAAKKSSVRDRNSAAANAANEEKRRRYAEEHGL